MNLHILPEITERKSIFSFSDKPVESEKINLLFEAARLAPSSSNLQPWRFIYSSKDNNINYLRLFDLLDDNNKKWANTAPVLGISITETIMEYKLKPNRFAFHDLGMAVGLLLVQATYLGLSVHQMGGYDVEKARQVLNIPERFEPAAMFAIGYKSQKEIPEEFQKKQLKNRDRRNINDFVFNGSWGIKI